MNEARSIGLHMGSTIFLSKMNCWELCLQMFLGFKDDNDGQTILFTYPKLTTKASEYIRPVVKIELGACSAHWPVSKAK
jgi:hypothetical protein